MGRTMSHKQDLKGLKPKTQNINVFPLFLPHLAFVLDGLFPCSPLLFALLPVARLGGDPRQVRVVDPRHALGLLGGQASGRKDVQRDTRFTGHTDRLYLPIEENKEKVCFKSKF